MSELLDSFRAQFPERCQTCPVMLGFCATAEAYERNAEATCKPLADAIDSDPFNLSALNAKWREIHADLLDMATANELETTHAVGRLAEKTEFCPGTKRGAPEYLPISWKVLAYLRNEKICRNPNLATVLQ